MPHIPPGFAQVNHRMRLGGDPEPMMVTLGIALTEIVLEDLDAIAADLFDAFVTCWDGFVSNFYAFTGVDMYVNFDSQNLVVNYNPVEVVGGVAQSATPQNTAYLFKKRTGLGGRANRGRGYVPGVVESNVGNSGELDTTVLANIQTALNAWHTEINGITGVDFPALLHVANIPAPVEITSFSIDPRVATQRRRLR